MLDRTISQLKLPRVAGLPPSLLARLRNSRKATFRAELLTPPNRSLNEISGLSPACAVCSPKLRSMSVMASFNNYSMPHAKVRIRPLHLLVDDEAGSGKLIAVRYNRKPDRVAFETISCAC